MSQVLLRRSAGSNFPVFDPRSLFADGTEGVLFDFSDISSMFQDSAGTTPAAVDQPVGKVNDLSGRGHHATSSGAFRPILRQTSGKYWLDFPDTAYLDVGSTAAETNFSIVSCIAGSYSVANTRVLIGKPHAGTHISPFFRWVIFHGVSNAYAVRINGTEYTTASAWTLSTNHITSFLSSEGKARFDESDSIYFPSAAITYANSTTLRIGANVAAGEKFFGRMYAIVLVAKGMSSIEVSNTEQWIKKRYV